MMKDKTTFKVPFDFSYTELTAVEEYLEQTERNGNHLKEIKKNELVFEFTQHKRNYRYCAEIFKGDAFVKEFISSCEKDGWEYVGVYRDELYVFRTTDPYASDIMTDKQQKIKTIAKRELLNPAFYGCGFYLVWRAIELLFLRTEYESLILANYLDCMQWLFLSFYVTWLCVKLIDVLIWYIKSKKCVQNDEKIPFINLKEHEQNRKVNQILLLAGTMVYFAASVFFSLGYVQADWMYWFIGGGILIEIFCLIYSKDKIKKDGGKNMSRHIIAVIATVAVVFGVWSTVLYSNNKYAENHVNRLDSVLEELHSEATVFAQHYWVKESVETSESDDIHTIRYEVFVSDISGARGQYINKLNKKFKKYDSHIVKLENDRWEEAYTEINDEGIAVGGYAVKDNKVVYIDYCYDFGVEKSLDVIYERLFEEKK